MEKRRDEGKGTGHLPADGGDQLSCITSLPLIKGVLLFFFFFFNVRRSLILSLFLQI